MSNPGLVKAFDVSGGSSVWSCSIVRLTGDGAISQASSATDFSIGIADSLGGDSGGRCEVALTGVAEVRAGGTVARGALVTSNAAGAAVTASPGNRVIGIALEAAVINDIFRVRIAQSVA